MSLTPVLAVFGRCAVDLAGAADPDVVEGECGEGGVPVGVRDRRRGARPLSEQLGL
jgi:hypothetical protein